ncbi:MAG: hypothetical protein EOM37_00060 [Proteobacteria bacterium]|jgi:hypothetical protein|nr:hypothetical protein [Alphaproteobacteria bacterium]NCC02432.1 hypothetical protein [Pseudomonadota bacterium]
MSNVPKQENDTGFLKTYCGIGWRGLCALAIGGAGFHALTTANLGTLADLPSFSGVANNSLSTLSAGAPDMGAAPMPVTPSFHANFSGPTKTLG